MARPKAKAPSLRYHISGQSVVTIEGRDFYLGKHDTPESFARYAVLIGIYQANGLKLPDGFDQQSIDVSLPVLIQPTRQDKLPKTVAHVVACYRDLIKVKYAQNPSELHRLGQICNELEKHEGKKLADEFGPLALQRQRQRWIDAGNSRPYCNRLTNAVVRMFKHAVSQELVKNETWQRLTSVEPLKIGQTAAPETEPRVPVSLDVVRKTAKELSPIVKAMLRVQVSTGMRPSEVCNIRPCDIDRSAEVWMFRPAKHKTANKGIKKAVPIVGDAREAITDYLNRDPEAFCFSPAESVAWHQATRRANRKTKVQPSQLSRAKDNPSKTPGLRFTAHSYRRAIQQGAKRAGVASWHPYQLRHLAGTVVRDALGIEAAQALLGHSEARMTEHYAKLNESKAIAAAQAAPKL